MSKEIDIPTGLGFFLMNWISVSVKIVGLKEVNETGQEVKVESGKE